MKDKLDGIWDTLPLEAREHLIAGERSYLGSDLAQAGVRLAEAAEATLGGWTTRLRVRPSERVRSLGDWAKYF